MARTFSPQDRPWKWRAVESEENQRQVFALFPPPLEIAKRRDFHIPTAATAILPFPTSDPKKRTRHTAHATHHFEIPSLPTPPRTECLHCARPSYPHQTARRPILVFEPAPKYQNVAKRRGILKLTPARALIAEIIRRYWVLGIECTYLEVQKLGWFLERAIESLGVDNSLSLRFTADRYGPYSDPLRHLLDGLDGSYLHCDKRLSDAGPTDTIWFDETRRHILDLYLKQECASPLRLVLDRTADLIDGFESPLGMELLATVDWLIERENCPPNVSGIRDGLRRWPAGAAAAQRKDGLFSDRLIELALIRLKEPFAPRAL